MNKTDFETLRASFGIRLAASLLPPLLPPLSSDRRFQGQISTEIAQSDSVQLAWLPGSGFGPKEVVRLDHVFEQPFPMGTAGDTFPTATMSSA